MLLKTFDFLIRWSFYALFFLAPLVFTSQTSELFEYNKMMLTYGFTILIAFLWISKNIATGHWSLVIGKLGIGLLIYLASHFLSTIFSIDPHTSIWGYYSRFHEGLLASISYVFLYFAAINNLTKSDVVGILKSSFAAGVIIALWGVAEHLGTSPSCVIFTGQADVACWIQDVKNRVFATLGQPNWMAAYLNVLILAALGFGIEGKRQPAKGKSYFYILLSVLFFIALLFTKSRSGILGLFTGLGVFGIILIIKEKSGILKNKILLLFALCSLLSVFAFGMPFPQLENYSLEKLLSPKSAINYQPPTTNSGYIDIGISESGDIRKIVWEGAVKIWQRYPILGSGVETFAHAYYKDRPATHNMVSEWDFLYNKAHNEYLNLLATTGLVGMGAYLLIHIIFAVWLFRRMTNDNWLVTSLFAAWTTILVTNFFGFSVVIIGLYFFLIPAFCHTFTTNYQLPTTNYRPGLWHYLAMGTLGFISFLGILNLITMWQADVAYALGQNYTKANYYTQGYKKLAEAVELNPNEPTFSDELAYSGAILAAAAENQKESTLAAELKDQSLALSDKALAISPNNLNFHKTRTKIGQQINDLQITLSALGKAMELAPTDAKIHLNYGLVLDAVGKTDEAIKILTETTVLKPNYAEAFYSLAEIYEKQKNMVKAREQYEYIFQNLGDPKAKEWLDKNP